MGPGPAACSSVRFGLHAGPPPMPATASARPRASTRRPPRGDRDLRAAPRRRTRPADRRSDPRAALVLLPPGDAASAAPSASASGPAREALEARSRRPDRQHRHAHLDLRRAGRPIAEARLPAGRRGRRPIGSAAAGTVECAGGWYRVKPRGYVCVGKGASRLLEHQVVQAAFRGPARHAPLPYQYVTSRSPPPHLYFRLPTLQGPDPRRGADPRRPPRRVGPGRVQQDRGSIPSLPSSPRDATCPSRTAPRRSSTTRCTRGARRRRPPSASSRRSSGRAAASASRPSSTSSRSIERRPRTRARSTA